MTNILCFGDSNTWGYNPVTKDRYSGGIRWTGKLQEKLGYDTRILEEGLCGRTTVFEDAYRAGKKGIDAIEKILEQNDNIDSVILMLGTNDCKTCNKSSARKIACGIDRCLEVILKYVPADRVLLISPIHLGDDVWKQEYDPEFSRHSVLVSHGLKREYTKIAKKRKVHFLAASDYVQPSMEDQEHLNADGHGKLAKVIFNKIADMNVGTYRISECD